MNKIIAFCCLFILISCSKDEQEKINSLKLSPPSWIHGTWNATNESADTSRLRFTNDALFTFNEEDGEINVLTSHILLMGLTGEEVTIEEARGDNFYGIKISTSSYNELYNFTRISANEISWDNAPPLNESEIYVRN